MRGQLVPGQAAGLVLGVAQFLDEDRVGAAQQFGVFVLDFAQDAHAQARAGERVAVDHLRRQAQGHAEFADFVLEQFTQRLQQLQVERVGQAAHVVVRLDGGGLAGLGACGFDDVGVNGALGQPLGALLLAGLVLEHFDEFTADDLALGFRIGHAGELAHELGGRVDVDDLHAHVLGEGLHNLLAFIQAQQAVVDEHAGELVADGLVDQRGGNRRIDAARQAQDHLFVADLFADARDGFGHVVGHVPVAFAAADFVHEAGQHGLALDGVRDFGVELHGVELAVFVGHAGDRAGRRGRHDLEARGQLGDLVAVAHPDLEHAVAFIRGEVGQAVEQLGVAMRADFGVAEFAVVGEADHAAQLLRHGLHAIADAQHGHAQLEHGVGHAHGAFFVGRGVAARQDDALQALRHLFAHEGVVDVARMHFGIHAGFADAAGDQLGDLRTVVENEDALVHGDSTGNE
ncbi:hypothetical protein FQZ97_543100 [compost metagenome]